MYDWIIFCKFWVIEGVNLVCLLIWMINCWINIFNLLCVVWFNLFGLFGCLLWFKLIWNNKCDVLIVILLVCNVFVSVVNLV